MKKEIQGYLYIDVSKPCGWPHALIETENSPTRNFRGIELCRWEDMAVWLDKFHNKKIRLIVEEME